MLVVIGTLLQSHLALELLSVEDFSAHHLHWMMLVVDVVRNVVLQLLRLLVVTFLVARVVLMRAGLFSWRLDFLQSLETARLIRSTLRMHLVWRSVQPGLRPLVVLPSTLDVDGLRLVELLLLDSDGKDFHRGDGGLAVFVSSLGGLGALPQRLHFELRVLLSPHLVVFQTQRAPVAHRVVSTVLPVVHTCSDRVESPNFGSWDRTQLRFQILVVERHLPLRREVVDALRHAPDLLGLDEGVSEHRIRHVVERVGHCLNQVVVSGVQVVHLVGLLMSLVHPK